MAFALTFTARSTHRPSSISSLTAPSPSCRQRRCKSKTSPALSRNSEIADTQTYCSFTLQMTVKRKLVVAFIFLAGFLVTGISIARLQALHQATETNFTCKALVPAGTLELCSCRASLDTYVDVSILSVAELNISIVRIGRFSFSLLSICSSFLSTTNIRKGC